MIREPFIAADAADAAADPELPRLKRAHRLALFLAVGVLLVCLTTALAVWQAFRQNEIDEFETRFHQQIDRYLHAIRLDLRAKENLLRGAAGLAAASELVTAREWSRYVSRLNIEPASGILAMGYSQRVVPALRESFETSMRVGGNPAFAISPPGDRPELQAITHVAPIDGPNGNTLGLDLFADPVLQRSIERASDTGEIVLSPIVRRLGESNQQSQVVLMIQPIYVDSMSLETPAQRAQGFVGFFFLEMRVDVDARSALPALDADRHVRILDTAATPAQELFASDESSPLLHDTIAASHKLPGFGREWTLHFSDHARPGTVFRGSAIVLASGILGSLLLALLTWRLAASRGQAELLARRITHDLRQSELGLKQSRALLSSVINGLPSAVLLKNESLEIQLANQAFCELVECSAAEVIGQRIGRLLDVRLADKLESDDLATLRSGDEQVSELVLPGNRGEFRTYQVRNVRLSGRQPQVLSIYTDISEVRAQSRLIRALIDHLPQRFMVKDRDSRFLLVNSKLAEDVGLTPEAMCGRCDEDFYTVELAQRYRADDRLVIESGQTRTVEEPHENGWQRTTKAPLRDGTGAVIGVVGILDDITERRAQEDQLREALARFESVVESTPLTAITSVDRDGIVRRWNPACTALYGIGRQDAIGHPLAELIYRSEMRPIFDKALACMFETGSGGGLAEWAFEMPSGRRIDVYSTMFPVIVGGEVREVFFMDVDISARKQVEARLRESEARWQFALEGSGDGVWDWNLRNDRVEFSARWKSMLGYSDEEIGNLLDEWCSRVHPDDLPQTMARVRAHLDGRSPDYVNEHRVRCKDGGYLWILDRGKVVERDPDGKPTRMIGTHTDITQRRLAEDRLRSSEMRWQSALEGAGDAVWDWNTVTNKVFFSKRWKEILGYSETEVGDELDEWSSRVHPDDLPRVLGDLQVHLEGRAEVYRSEFRLRRKDGSYLWVHDRGKIVEREPDGRPSRVIGRFSDISERRKAEQALSESEARFRLMADSTPNLVWVADQTGGCTYFNKTWFDFTGRTLDQERDVGWAAGVHSGDRDRCLSIYAAAFDEQRTFEMEYRLRRHDGEYRWLLDTGIPRYSASGEFLGYIGSCTDITERREMEAEVGRSRDLLGVINRLQDDFIRDPDSNRVFENMLGWLLAKANCEFGVIGEALNEPDGSRYMSSLAVSKIAWDKETGLFQQDNATPLLEVRDPATLFGSLLASDQPVISNDAAIDPPGIDLPLGYPVIANFVGLPIRSGDELIGMVGLTNRSDGFDATLVAEFEPLLGALGKLLLARRSDMARKEAETELARHRDHLREMVEEQTSEARASRDEAQRANRVKSEFLANMSHELRTPMHAILSFAKLGEARSKKDGQPKLNDYFDRIRVSGDRLLTLLNDLLDLSKLEAGKMVLDLHHHSIGRLVREAVREFEGMFQAKGVQLHIHDAVATPEIPVDTARIGQVLRNLLSNAVKFTPAGRTVEVRVLACEIPLGRRRDDQGRTRQGVQVVVSDEGVGIPESELERVFDKFVQSTKTRTGAGGTGLGLAICREIVKAHHGTVFARPNAKGGTDLVVQLPASPNAVVSNLFSQG